MSEGSGRETVAICAMALAGVVAVVMLVNHRIEQRVNDRRMQVSALTVESQSAPNAERLNQMRAQTTTLREWMTRGVMHDDIQLYSRVMDLGESFALRIDRIDPVTDENEDKTFAQRTRFSIDATGPYEQVARFLDAIEQEPGFHVVTRLSISPAEGDGNVHAVISTEHHDFNPDEAPARMAYVDEEDDS